MSRADFSMVFDALHAVTGAYADPLLVKELGGKPVGGSTDWLTEWLQYSLVSSMYYVLCVVGHRTVAGYAWR